MDKKELIKILGKFNKEEIIKFIKDYNNKQKDDWYDMFVDGYIGDGVYVSDLDFYDEALLEFLSRKSIDLENIRFFNVKKYFKL